MSSMAVMSILVAALLVAIRFHMFRRSYWEFYDEIFDMYIEQLILHEDKHYISPI